MNSSHHNMNKLFMTTPGRCGLLVFALIAAVVCCQCTSPDNLATLPAGDPDNGKLSVPEGFEVTVVVDSVGRARHLAINDNGDIYVKLRAVTPQAAT
jgi:hypothetical protein